jgi:hypothetical protein
VLFASPVSSEPVLGPPFEPVGVGAVDVVAVLVGVAVVADGLFAGGVLSPQPAVKRAEARTATARGPLEG